MSRKLETLITRLYLERPIAHLPRQLRFAIARRRYGWIDGLARLRHQTDGEHSLVEAEKLNAIFVHIPKAAGLSVAQSLFGNNAASHTPLYMYLALYGAHKFDRMYKFSFVRNPWNRAVSAYNFLSRGGLTATDKTWAETHLTKYKNVNDFICHGLPAPEIQAWQHFKPQMHYLRDPRSGGVGVDFLGHFETLPQDFKTVCRHLGCQINLEHVNKSENTTPLLSSEAIAVITELYKEDITMFGYTNAAPTEV